MKYEAVVMHGGGLDSTAVFLSLAPTMKEKLCALHVNYGQIARQAEWAVVVRQSIKYGAVAEPYDELGYLRAINPQPSIMFGTSHSSPKLNMRNTQMVMLGALYADKIYLGLDRPWNDLPAWEDASKHFISVMNEMLAISITDRKVEVIAPFIDIPKIDVCKQAYKVDKDFFELSMTCWAPKEANHTLWERTKSLECGTCKHCKIKAEIKQAVLSSQQGVNS